VKRFSDKNCGKNKELEQLGEPSETKTALSQGEWTHQGDIVHIFTHFRLEMSVYLLSNVDEADHIKGWWVEKQRLKQEALPSVMKKILTLIYPDAFSI